MNEVQWTSVQFAAQVMGLQIGFGPASPRSPLGQLEILQWEMDEHGLAPAVQEVLLARAMQMSHVCQEWGAARPLVDETWVFDEDSLALVDMSVEWSGWVRRAGETRSAREIFGSTLGLLGRSWPDRDACHDDVFANHAGGLPVELAHAVVAACTPGHQPDLP